MGQAFVALETVHLLTRQAALVAEGTSLMSEEITAYVNLARTAVEFAALGILRLVQRSIGLAAFLSPSPIERVFPVSTSETERLD
jgi:hypothetical protein